MARATKARPLRHAGRPQPPLNRTYDGEFDILHLPVDLPTFAQCKFGVRPVVSKPSSQGRLEGATGKYVCVFETTGLMTNGIRSALDDKPRHLQFLPPQTVYSQAKYPNWGNIYWTHPTRSRRIRGQIVFGPSRAHGRTEISNKSEMKLRVSSRFFTTTIGLFTHSCPVYTC